jgi:hypothetical protein
METYTKKPVVSKNTKYFPCKNSIKIIHQFILHSVLKIFMLSITVVVVFTCITFFTGMFHSCLEATLHNKGLIKLLQLYFEFVDRFQLSLVYLGQLESKNMRSVFHKRKTCTLCGHCIVATLYMWPCDKSNSLFSVYMRNFHHQWR